MNGWGNDFVVFAGPLELTSTDVAALCDRRFGVGADGVLIVTPGDPIDMGYWNADGSPAEMCGNGLRCVAQYAFDRGWVDKPEFEVQTPDGVRMVSVGDGTVEVEIGSASVLGHTKINGDRYHLIEIGNPHAVVEVEEPDSADVAGIGASLQTDERFPLGTNVEFVRFDADGLTMRVWERGVGETLACGTGMVAAAFVATKAVKMSAPMKVRVPGGEGEVDFRDGTGWLKGPASYSFQGVWTRALDG
jgi:diaminopimelate epimerase